MSERITVLHDTGGLIAVDKPAGLESTGRAVDDPGGVQHHLQTQLRRPLWLVHQLDRDTTGVLLFVRKRRLVAEWQARLRRAQKRYLALVHGTLEPVAATFDAPIGYDRALRRWRVDPEGKPARTTARRLDAAGGVSLVEARIRTGRTHQVRVHLAQAGHPLVGERLHRDPPCELTGRQMLHAWRLEVDDLSLEAPIPRDFADAMKRWGLGLPA